ncbi:hypothetical protein BLOT_007038 [Blomia tropicalis]|nr:hypothetical protein BLOT_007038 [Blomia tropicalis]
MGGNEQRIEYTGNSLIIIYNDENDDLHCDIDLDCYRRLMGYNVTITVIGSRRDPMSIEIGPQLKSRLSDLVLKMFTPIDSHECAFRILYILDDEDEDGDDECCLQH